MSIIDDIRAQLSANVKRYDYRVYVGGLRIQTAGPPRYSSSLDNIYDSMTIPIAVWDDALLREGQEVVVEEGLNGYFIRTFTGEIHEPSKADFPLTHSFLAVDRMWRATLEGGVARQWAYEDETQIAKDLLTISGVPYTDDGIEGGGWTLGTRQPIVLGVQDAPETLLREMDRLAGFRTRSNRNGEAVRVELPRFPGAADHAAFDYAHDPVPGELGVLDEVQTGGSGRAGIRNRIILTGPNLFGLSQVAGQQIAADLDEWVSLWYADVVPESVIVTDITGDVTYIRDDGEAVDPDYEVDGPNGAIKALSTGAITDGQALLVSYSYELTDGQIESTVSAENQYLPIGKYQTEPVPGPIVQDLDKADEITDRLGIELNRTHVVLTVPVEANILLEVGQTISYRDPKLGLPNATPFMVTAIDREFNRMTIRAVGGDGGPLGVRAPRPPRARFLPIVFRFGDFVRVYVDGIYSWDPDGDIVSYAWEDTEANTATGVTAEFDYPFSLGSVSISLVVMDALGLVSPVYTREVDFANPDYVLDVFVRWLYEGPPGSPGPGENVSINQGFGAYLGRWFGDETAQAIDAAADGVNGYGPLMDVQTPLAPYFNRQRFALAQGGWGWYPTYTVDRYADVVGAPTNDYVFTTFDGQKKLLMDVQWTWQWWDSDLAMGVKNMTGPYIKVSIANTDPLSDSHFTRTIPNARVLSRSLGEKLWKIWFEREDPAHIMVASEAFLFESFDQGATWQIPVTSEEAFVTDAQISAIVHGATIWMISRHTAVPVTQPVYLSDGTKPIFPEAVEVKTISASPSADRFMVNHNWLIEQVDGVWTVTEVTYYSSLDPLTPENPLLFVQDDALPIFHPVEEDLIVLTLVGGAWKAFLLQEGGVALRAAVGLVTSDPDWGPYINVQTNVTDERINVAVMSHAKPPVTPVTVLSSTAVKVYLGNPPDGWLNTSFDTSGWDNAIVVG